MTSFGNQHQHALLQQTGMAWVMPGAPQHKTVHRTISWIQQCCLGPRHGYHLGLGKGGKWAKQRAHAWDVSCCLLRLRCVFCSLVYRRHTLIVGETPPGD